VERAQINLFKECQPALLNKASFSTLSKNYLLKSSARQHERDIKGFFRRVKDIFI
jgi:hypothetical protein